MQNYLQLLNKIDALVAKIRACHPDSFKCRPGCADCCVAGITVCRVEFDNINRHSSCSAQCAVRGAQCASDKCSWLDKRGECRIYAHRPIVCRLWGAPLLFSSDTDLLRASPSTHLVRSGRSGSESRSHVCSRLRSNSKWEGEGILTACEKNFQKSPSLEELVEADIISMDRILQMLAAINHVYCKKHEFDSSERFELSMSMRDVHQD